jgi:hypothetical protein
MRFLIPAQTIAEYRHQQMPVYETIAAIGATTIVGTLTVGGLAGAAATAGAGALAAYGVNQALNSGKGGAGGGGGGGGGVPGYSTQDSLALQQQQYQQMAGQSLGFGKSAYDQASAEGIDFAKRGTQANIANQNKVTPGSSAQRQLAQNQINQYIQGNVPTDVQQNINRQVAQNLGGGYNMFTQGGQAPQNFARNIGQTSLGLSQFGLSAAPTWQQLSNSMVVRPEAGLSAGLQAISLGNQLASSAAGYGQTNAENQYQGAFNQYQGNQLANQQQAQMGMQLGQLGLQGIQGLAKANYYNNLSQTGQGYANTIGALPSASTANSYMSDLGYNPTSFTALPNTGAGTAYPFGR